jgi:hypothetical protein
MPTSRTLLTFFVALSLAMLPMAGAFAVPKHEVTTSEVVVTSAHDCCDESPAGPMVKECQASAGCFAKCFNFFAVMFSGATIPPPISGAVSPFASEPFCSQTASPPFRPPRV